MSVTSNSSDLKAIQDTYSWRLSDLADVGDCLTWLTGWPGWLSDQDDCLTWVTVWPRWLWPRWLSDLGDCLTYSRWLFKLGDCLIWVTVWPGCSRWLSDLGDLTWTTVWSEWPCNQRDCLTGETVWPGWLSDLGDCLTLVTVWPQRVKEQSGINGKLLFVQVSICCCPGRTSSCVPGDDSHKETHSTTSIDLHGRAICGTPIKLCTKINTPRAVMMFSHFSVQYCTETCDNIITV